MYEPHKSSAAEWEWARSAVGAASRIWRIARRRWLRQVTEGDVHPEWGISSMTAEIKCRSAVCCSKKGRTYEQNSFRNEHGHKRRAACRFCGLRPTEFAH